MPDPLTDREVRDWLAYVARGNPLSKLQAETLGSDYLRLQQRLAEAERFIELMDMKYRYQEFVSARPDREDT